MNEEAIRFLTEQITGMRVIRQELTQIYTSTIDFNLADNIRQRLTSYNEILFALESTRNSLIVASTVVPPPSQGRIEALTRALRQLDNYVRSDQNIHMALNYLTQVADMISEA
jgi:predicted O-methyltransferase YrrM